jgi:hypothetical protein
LLQIVDLMQKVFSSLAMLVASLWAYYTYFRGRTFRDRLELELTGTVQQEGEIEYLTVTIRVKMLVSLVLQFSRKALG